MFKKELRGCRDGSEEILPAKELQTRDYTEQVFIYVLATPRDIPDLVPQPAIKSMPSAVEA